MATGVSSMYVKCDRAVQGWAVQFARNIEATAKGLADNREVVTVDVMPIVATTDEGTAFFRTRLFRPSGPS